MGLTELVRQTVAVLRYIAGPALGIVVIWLVDEGHDVTRIAAQAIWPWSSPPSPWPLLAVLALVGVTVYFAHRTLVHPFITMALEGFHNRKRTVKLSTDDLDFARWQRRGSNEHTPAHSTQAALDVSNAAIHFFYCSGWSSVLLAVVFSNTFPQEFQLGSVGGFVFIVALLFVIAVVGDWRLARLDMEAYDRHNAFA